MSVLQVPLQGGPQRQSPQVRQKAVETVQQRTEEGGGQRVDKTQFSRELTEEVARSGDPLGNVDQMIVAMQGLHQADQPRQSPHKPLEVGAAGGVGGGISGDTKKRKPRVERSVSQPRQSTPRPPQQQSAPGSDRARDRVELSKEVLAQAV